MFKRRFLRPVSSDDGFTFVIRGKNALILKRGGIEYYVFIEPLATEKLSFQMDRSGVWLDKAFKTRLLDEDMKMLILSRAEGYLIFAGIGFE